MLDEYNSVFKFSFVVTPINPLTPNIPFSNSITVCSTIVMMLSIALTKG